MIFYPDNKTCDYDIEDEREEMVYGKRTNRERETEEFW